MWLPISEHDGSSDPVLLWFPDLWYSDFKGAQVQPGYWDTDPFPDGPDFDTESNGGEWRDTINHDFFLKCGDEVFPSHFMPLPAGPTTDEVK